jgi:hypothetical protein
MLDNGRPADRHLFGKLGRRLRVPGNALEHDEPCRQAEKAEEFQGWIAPHGS